MEARLRDTVDLGTQHACERRNLTVWGELSRHSSPSMSSFRLKQLAGFLMHGVANISGDANSGGT